MPSSLDSLAMRFFGSVGLVEPAGYRIVEVLLDDSVRPYFGGRDYMVFTTSAEVARENPEAQLLAHGSPLLEAMAEASLALGYAAHFYLNGLNLTRGRTLEKVRQDAPDMGYVLEIGDEEPYLYHHVAFRFKVSLVADGREEAFHDVAVDLHSGWATTKLEDALLRLYGSQEPMLLPETHVELGLNEACGKAMEEVRRAIAPWAQARQLSLRLAAHDEQAQVSQHYQAIVERLEEGKSRKGTNLERIEEKIRSTLADRERRLEDVERKHSLGIEAALVQLAIVSYPKVAVPLLVQQGRAKLPGMAVWDPLVRQGYFHRVRI